MKKLTQKTLKIITKDIVLHCFRNTIIEDYHAKKKISDKEMKILMIEVVDKLYTFMLAFDTSFGYKFKKEFTWFVIMNRMLTAKWDDPKILKDWVELKK